MTQNTNILEEAYKRIITSKELQTKFMEAAKENKLETFLKEEKIDATLDEVKAYLTKKFVDNKDVLSKEELDMAAGGSKGGDIAFSLVTIGFGCIISAAIEEESEKCTF